MESESVPNFTKLELESESESTFSPILESKSNQNNGPDLLSFYTNGIGTGIGVRITGIGTGIRVIILLYYIKGSVNIHKQMYTLSQRPITELK